MSEISKADARKEALSFLLLFLGGLVALPALIYTVGSALFGDYGGTGFSAFYGSLHSDLRAGELAGWFLVLSPYIVWQLARSTMRLSQGLETAS